MTPIAAGKTHPQAGRTVTIRYGGRPSNSRKNLPVARNAGLLQHLLLDRNVSSQFIPNSVTSCFRGTWTAQELDCGCVAASAQFLPSEAARPLVQRNETKHPQEVPIRTFGVGLMAIAAVAAGLVLSRARTDREEARPTAGEALRSSLSLEALRAAGM